MSIVETQQPERLENVGAVGLSAGKAGQIGSMSAVNEGRQTTTILLADDHRIVREALVPYLRKAAEDVEVIEASSMQELFEIAAQPDAISLVIVNLDTVGMQGIANLHRLRDLRPNVPIAILSNSLNADDIETALNFGVMGYLPTTMVAPAFVNAVSLVLHGERFVPSEYFAAGRDRPRVFPTEDGRRMERSASGLTPRQWAVLRELMRGQANKQIARTLGIEEITVKVHLHGVFKRLNVANRTQAVTLALRRGWFLGDATAAAEAA